MPCPVPWSASNHQLFHFHAFLTQSRFPHSVVSFLPLATCIHSGKLSLLHKDSIEFLRKDCLLSSIMLPSCGKAPKFLQVPAFP